MRSVSTVRLVDPLGRIVIPKEIRTSLRMNEKDPVEIFVEEDKVILRRHDIACVICGSHDGLKNFKGKKVCSGCIECCSEMSNSCVLVLDM